jgi:hypothetical protein
MNMKMKIYMNRNMNMCKVHANLLVHFGIYVSTLHVRLHEHVLVEVQN